MPLLLFPLLIIALALGTNIYMLTLGDYWSSNTIDLYLHRRLVYQVAHVDIHPYLCTAVFIVNTLCDVSV